jgi:hypothetical protein
VSPDEQPTAASAATAANSRRGRIAANVVLDRHP